MKKQKLYVGCALSHAPQEFRDGVVKLKEKLREVGFEILEFALVGDKPQEGVNIYDYDMSNVGNCDMFVVIADLPSTGLGMELERAKAISKPVLVFAHEESYVTNMITHMLVKYGYSEVVRYKSHDEIPSHVEAKIEALELARNGPLFA